MVETRRRVSVIIPTNNRPAMLRQALASVRALEGPDLEIEILIGDNGVLEETPKIAAEFGARYFKEPKRGAGPARNAGLKNATGDYIALLDDDDCYLPEMMRPHLAVLDARAEIDAVIGQVVYTDHALVPFTGPVPAVSPGEGDDMLRAMLGTWFPQVGTLVARRSILDTVGLQDEIYEHGEDVDWFLRIAQTRRVAFTPTACILFRGRPYGTFDDLNRARTKAGRRVFLTYALPEWKIWRSFDEFWAGYRARLDYFYTYFAQAAKDRAKAGKVGEAIISTLDAMYVFPFRVVLSPLGKIFRKPAADVPSNA